MVFVNSNKRSAKVDFPVVYMCYNAKITDILHLRHLNFAQIYKNKKSLLCFRTADFQFSLEFVLNYSALVESQQAAVESQAAESATTSSTTAASSTTATESVASVLLLAALFPQDAKDTAAKATNKKY